MRNESDNWSIIPSGNIFADVPRSLDSEQTRPLWTDGNVRIERIVSTAHATPEGDWYDQDHAEWVVVLVGSAGLRVEGENAVRALKAGDFIALGAGVRHRVEWTSADEPTVWLAVRVALDGETP